MEAATRGKVNWQFAEWSFIDTLRIKRVCIRHTHNSTVQKTHLACLLHAWRHINLWFHWVKISHHFCGARVLNAAAATFLLTWIPLTYAPWQSLNPLGSITVCANSLAHSQLMMDTLTIVGRATATEINPAKSRGPATELVVLGLLYCSRTHSCRLGDARRAKYMSRIQLVISAPVTTSKQLEQLAGNLSFAA